MSPDIGALFTKPRTGPAKTVGCVGGPFDGRLVSLPENAIDFKATNPKTSHSLRYFLHKTPTGYRYASLNREIRRQDAAIVEHRIARKAWPAEELRR